MQSPIDKMGRTLLKSALQRIVATGQPSEIKTAQRTAVAFDRIATLQSRNNLNADLLRNLKFLTIDCIGYCDT